LSDLEVPPGAGHGSIDAELASDLAGCRKAHVRLLETVAGLDEASVRSPSRLEGWTVGHVLTHLARNADSHTRMLVAALGGGAVEAVEQYAGGPEERARAIEAGAGRPPAELRHDVERSTAELEATWAAMTPHAWNGHGLSRGEPWPCVTMPFFRWREVEIHHVDAGTGYEPDDWPDEYVGRELPLLLDTLPGRLAQGHERRRLLAWLAGRAPSPGPLDLDPWESRRANYFGTRRD
jgi:maleylpyruvate isomerase